ncbi:ribonuclease H-like domain-containing protein [Mycena crocata]|nr:ribonuclease H-like domain-containing protein [Mycena crocata]
MSTPCADAAIDGVAGGVSGVRCADLPTFVVHYLNTEVAVNEALATIVDGVIGFDSEFVKREPTPEEKVINYAFFRPGLSRKTAILGWQVVEDSLNPNFPYAWNTMGLCVVQIARGNVVWVINVREMRAYPAQLRRVLTSPDIIKAGVGIANDVAVFWNDMRSELQRLVDPGLMTRLLLPDKFSEGGFQNVGMEDCAKEILGYRVDKSLQVSDWAARLSEEQIRYAATDAVVALRLYEVLARRLEVESRIIGMDIPIAWYGFNSKLADGVLRLYRNYDQSVDQGPVQMVSAFRALNELVTVKQGAGIVMYWKQTAGIVLVGGDSRIIRVWDAGTETSALVNDVEASDFCRRVDVGSTSELLASLFLDISHWQKENDVPRPFASDRHREYPSKTTCLLDHGILSCETAFAGSDAGAFTSSGNVEMDSQPNCFTIFSIDCALARACEADKHGKSQLVVIEEFSNCASIKRSQLKAPSISNQTVLNGAV